jgi:hypothetical protein
MWIFMYVLNREKRFPFFIFLCKLTVTGVAKLYSASYRFIRSMLCSYNYSYSYVIPGRETLSRWNLFVAILILLSSE